MTLIYIVDYGMGNLASVHNALITLGASARVSSSPRDIKNAEKVILPGVGAFGAAMAELKKRKLMAPIADFLAEGKPFLGICLGLQLLFSYSEEGKRTKGFGIIKGKVVRFPKKKGLKVPHIGWNGVKIKNQKSKIKNSLLDGIKNNSYFYFDHSYYAVPLDKNVIAATTDYGVRFASFIAKDNIFAAQFHPEKSQSAGLKMLENFIKC